MKATHYLPPYVGRYRRTACGRAPIKYDSAGNMVSSVKVTDDPGRVTCRVCNRRKYGR